MSRKKIVIKMPSADRADAGEPSSEAMAGSHAEALGGAFGPSGDAESDRWIRAEDVVPLPDDPSARSASPTPGLSRSPATGLDDRSRRGPNVHAGSRVEFLPSLGARLVLGGERGQAVSPVVRRPTLTPNPRFDSRATCEVCGAADFHRPQVDLGLARRPSRGRRQQACEGLFSFFGRLCRAFKKNRRALYRPPPTGTINLPPPGFRRVASQLYDDRIIGRVKSFPFFAHAQ